MSTKKGQTKRKTPAKDLLEEASPWSSVGKILPTSTKSRLDVFKSFRPTKQCVDYSISETWTKMQKGDLKVNVKQTVATYKDIPPEICKPKRAKKTKMFSGGPPQWKFVDELWRVHVDGTQLKLKQEQQKASKQIKVQRADRHNTAHFILQEMVGPDWFMELNPKQLQAVDELRQAVVFDFSKGGTIYCEQLLAELGLVLRPNRHHIRTALKHSCGDAVEFLLVLYQLMNPSRTSYSLNDRLMLSAVVHLSLMSTLKELHVRIPSPPSQTKSPPAPKKRIVKIKNKSPYLQPLTYQPPAPKFSGVYKNKHRQYPESPYFAYILPLQEERKLSAYGPPTYSWQSEEEMQEYMKEYRAAQQFYESMEEVKHAMLYLVPPRMVAVCPNWLHPTRKMVVNQHLIAPNLCKVSSSEELVCFCEETCPMGQQKFRKKSSCEKSAQEFLDSQCFCDDCLEQTHQQASIRIHGGLQSTSCQCDEPVPIIQGVLNSRPCDCYREYRDKIVACAARQRLIAQETKIVLGDVFMTKLGPIYHIVGTRGKKICLCSEILERKAIIRRRKDSLKQNETKLVLGGVAISKLGPIFCVSGVVARTPCSCILSYRQKLNVLIVQNKVRAQQVTLVNNGLINGKHGPVYHFSGVLEHVDLKGEQLPAICSCEIEKTKCFQHCIDYLDYKDQNHKDESLASGSSESCVDGLEEESCVGDWKWSNGSSDINEANGSQVPCCPPKSKLCGPCPSRNSTTSTDTVDTESTSNSSTAEHCQCKSALDRLMQSKCPCEECNRKIRQEYATFIMGGAKTTPSGNQINVVQAVHQPLCSCMHNHLENIRKVEDYKGRIQARYNLKKQPKKYHISGIYNTPKGPVYIIAGMRVPVDCECAKAIRETEEAAAVEKQRAKPINTGRIKYGISGVKAMPEENIYIVSGSVPVPPCTCETLLSKFEKAHKSCMEEFEQFIQHSEMEKSAYDTELVEALHHRARLRSIDINFAKGFENYPSNMFLMKQSPHDLQERENVLNELREINQESDDAVNQEQPVVAGETLQQDRREIEDEADYAETPIEEAGDFRQIVEKSSSFTPSDSDSTISDSAISESASCHVDPPKQVVPITIHQYTNQPDSFLTKRFAIFRRMPKCRKTLMQLLRHILDGMAEDGFALAKLPQVYKLPIFKLWIEMRCKTSWSYEDKVKSYAVSKTLWRHSDVCYKHPRPTAMPYTIEKARTMTWRDAKHIKRVAGEKQEEFYRQLKRINIETGREFFATTFAYEFPTSTWRDCAFAYIPTKEENIFPFKVVQSHESRVVPDNRRFHCYC